MAEDEKQVGTQQNKTQPKINLRKTSIIMMLPSVLGVAAFTYTISKPTLEYKALISEKSQKVEKYLEAESLHYETTRKLHFLEQDIKQYRHYNSIADIVDGQSAERLKRVSGLRKSKQKLEQEMQASLKNSDVKRVAELADRVRKAATKEGILICFSGVPVSFLLMLYFLKHPLYEKEKKDTARFNLSIDDLARDSRYKPKL